MTTLIEGVSNDRLKPTLSFEQFLDEHPHLKLDADASAEENMTPEERAMKQALVDGFTPADLPLKDELPEVSVAASDGVWYSFGVGRSMDPRRFGVCVAAALTDKEEAMAFQGRLSDHILVVQDPGEATDMREVAFTDMCPIQVLCDSQWVCIPSPGNTVPARIQSMMEQHNNYMARLWNDNSERLKAKQREGDVQFEQFTKEHGALAEGGFPEKEEEEPVDPGAVYDLPSLADLKVRADDGAQQQQSVISDAEKRMVIINDANEKNEDTVVVMWFVCGDTRDAGLVMRVVGPFEDDAEMARAIEELGTMYPTAEIRSILTNSFGVMDVTEDANWSLMHAMPHAHRLAAESSAEAATADSAAPNTAAQKKKKKKHQKKTVAARPQPPPSIAIGGKPGFKLPREASKDEWDKYDAFLSHAQRQYLRHCKEHGIAPEPLKSKPTYKITAITADGAEHVVDSSSVVAPQSPPLPPLLVDDATALPAAIVDDDGGDEAPAPVVTATTIKRRNTKKLEQQQASNLDVRLGRR